MAASSFNVLSCNLLLSFDSFCSFLWITFSRGPYDLGWSFRNVYMSSLHISGTLGLYGLGWSFRKIYMVSFCSSGTRRHNDLVGLDRRMCMRPNEASLLAAAVDFSLIRFQS